MSKGIMVSIPEIVYVSYNPQRTVENYFSIILHKEYIKPEDVAPSKSIIIDTPTIYIRGFEQFFEKEKAISSAERFIQSLVLGDMKHTSDSDWKVEYQYNDGDRTLDILIKYMGDELSQNFAMKISSDSFVCSNKDTQNSITLTVDANEFSTLFGENPDDYISYTITTALYYAPCITKFTAGYDGITYSKSLFVNPSHANEVELSWSIAGNGRIEYLLSKNNHGISNGSSVVGSITDKVEESTDCTYTLKADNKMGFTDYSQIEMKITNWRRAGTVSGLFNDSDSFDPGKNSMRIFSYRNNYYCYRKATLYKSTDGCIWELASENTTPLTRDDTGRVACGLYDDEFYIMSGIPGSKLKITVCDFRDNKWKASSAHQNCASEDGSLAFSGKLHYYAQTTPLKVRLTGHESDSDWNKWNSLILDIHVNEGNKPICSDICFWKDMFYVVILRDDGYFYLYKCNEEIESPLLTGRMSKKDRIFLLPTINKLFIAAKGVLYDTHSEQTVDDFLPPAEGEPWLGSDDNSVFGVFPDKGFWIYKI